MSDGGWSRRLILHADLTAGIVAVVGGFECTLPTSDRAVGRQPEDEVLMLKLKDAQVSRAKRIL
jgi:hypothetical protein